MLETGQIGTLDPDFAQLALDRHETRRFRRLNLFPGHHTLALHLGLGISFLVLLDIALLILDDDLFLDDGHLLDGIHRNREFLDIVGKQKRAYGGVFVNLPPVFLINAQRFLGERERCEKSQINNGNKNFFQNKPLVAVKLTF